MMERSIEAGMAMRSHEEAGDDPDRREVRREPVRPAGLAGALKSARSYVNPWAECWGPCRGTARQTDKPAARLAADRMPMSDTTPSEAAAPPGLLVKPAPQAPAAETLPPTLHPVPDGTLARVLPVINNKGLHARASAKFVQTVEGFDAEVTVSRGGETVGGRSIMGLMMLAAARGTTITVTARGPEAEAAMAAVEALLASKFGEEC